MIKPCVTLLFYNHIIEKNFIKKHKYIFNLHYTLLPKYKGINGLERSLNSKNMELGCTFHAVNEEVDSGEIIIQRKFKKFV